MQELLSVHLFGRRVGISRVFENYFGDVQRLLKSACADKRLKRGPKDRPCKVESLNTRVCVYGNGLV